MASTAFTQNSLERALPREDGRRFAVWDPKTPGLCLRVTGKGSKSWYWDRKVGRRHEKVRIAGFNEITLKKARQLAAQLNGELASGANPADRKRAFRSEMTFDELWKEYLRRHAKPNKRSWRNDEKQYKKHIKPVLGSQRLSEITRVGVTRLHTQIAAKTNRAGGPIAANRVLGLVSSMFGWAISQGFGDINNPCLGVRRSREIPRTRYLDAAEMRSFLGALSRSQNNEFADVVRLLLFTGQRKGNVLGMRWNDLDMRHKTWTIPADQAKAGRIIVVPLVPAVMEILWRQGGQQAGGTVFRLTANQFRWLWDRLLESAGFVQRLRPHDLRRTLATWALEHGGRLEVVGAMLGHAPQGITATVYAKVSTDSVRRAFEWTTQAMLRAGDIDVAKVVNFYVEG